MLRWSAVLRYTSYKSPPRSRAQQSWRTQLLREGRARRAYTTAHDDGRHDEESRDPVVTAPFRASSEEGSWDTLLDASNEISSKHTHKLSARIVAELDQRAAIRESEARQRELRAYLSPRQAVVEDTRRADAALAQKNVRGSMHRDIYIGAQRHPSALFSTTWQTEFAQLQKQYDRTMPDDYLREVEAPRVHSYAQALATLVLEKMDANEPLDMAMIAESINKPVEQVWSDLALWLLHYQKHRAVDFLLATHSPPYPPINMVEDCLQYLANYSDHVEDTATQKVGVDKLAEALIVLAHRETVERLMFHTNFVRILLRHCSEHLMSDLYKTVKDNAITLPANTWLQLAHYLANRDYHEESLDALLEAYRAEGYANILVFRKACTTVLRASMRHPDGLRLTLRIVETLVGLGLKLDRQLYNVIMLNAVEAGDFDTALGVHRAALDQGLAANEHTCAILLKLCKGRIDDAELIKDVIQLAIEHGDVRENRLIADEILHTLALHHGTHNPNSAFTTLQNAYVQLFDPSPLRILGIEISDDPLSSNDGAPQLIQPDTQTLACMIAIRLKKATYADARAIYQRWRELVEGGTAPFASAATTPHIATIFLEYFTRRRGDLLQAAQVVRDMQHPLPAAAGVVQAPPSVVTWSVFLHGFVTHRQPKLAAQVINYMRTKGIEPNAWTWGSLVAGVARAQDLDGTLEVLRRMERSGVAYDAFTFKGLSRFHDGEKLRAELEKMQSQQRLDCTGELKEGLEKRVAALGSDEPLKGDFVAEGKDGITELRKSEGPSDTVDRLVESPLVVSAAAFADSPAEMAEQGHDQ